MIGWDVGGVNTKVASVAGGRVLAVRGRPYVLQRAPGVLVQLLRELAAEVHIDPDVEAHAVTMTAELSDAFRTKREGVAFVLDAAEAAFGSPRVLTVAGELVPMEEARARPWDVAAANWMATALAVAGAYRDALLIDVGSTTAIAVEFPQSLQFCRAQFDVVRVEFDEAPEKIGIGSETCICEGCA